MTEILINKRWDTVETHTHTLQYHNFVVDIQTVVTAFKRRRGWPCVQTVVVLSRGRKRERERDEEIGRYDKKNEISSILSRYCLGSEAWGGRAATLLCCGAGSISHRGDELAPPMLAAYYVLYWWSIQGCDELDVLYWLTIDICCDICVWQIFEIKRVYNYNNYYMLEGTRGPYMDMDRGTKKWQTTPSVNRKYTVQHEGLISK